MIHSTSKTRPVALVTGASGFIGQHVVVQLLRQGFEVATVARNSKAVQSLRSLGCEVLECDLFSAPDQLLESKIQPHYVFHLAAKTRSPQPEELLLANPEMTQNVLEFCKSRRNPSTLVYVSSLAAVGPSKTTPVDENTTLTPVSVYGKSKALCEQQLHRHSGQLPISIVRPPIVFGPGDAKSLQMFKSIWKLNLHPMPGNGNQKFSLIHVSELATALLTIAMQGQRLAEQGSQGVYFVCRDEAISYRELGKLIGAAMNRNPFSVPIPNWLLRWIGQTKDFISRLRGNVGLLNSDKISDALAGGWTCSNEKFKSEFGFRFSGSLSALFHQTYQYYLAAGWLKSGSDSDPLLPENVSREILNPAARSAGLGNYQLGAETGIVPAWDDFANLPPTDSKMTDS